MSNIIVGSGGSNAVQRAPTYVEERVQKELEQIDRHLGLGWHEALERYYISCRWHDSDPRWESYRNGEIGKPEDILGWFTQDGAKGEFDSAGGLPADPLALMDKVVEYLGKMDQTRETWKERMRKSIEHNRELQRKMRQEAGEEIQDELAYHRKRIFNEPIKRGVVFDANGNLVAR